MAMQPVYIIAEAGINHGGSLDVAQEMVRVAAASGVNAVKFQSFTAAGLAHSELAADQHAFFRRFELSRSEHSALAEICRSCGVDFLSTPFDLAAADMLAELDVPAFKIASCDLTNLPLIRHCASFGKPLYISTGMGNIKEARSAAVAARVAGASEVVLLQCTTNYPTAYADVNLRAISSLARELSDLHGVSSGFSDHSIGNWCCFGAVALGARVIEKHFCLDKSAPGPDIACSCSPDELSELVQGIRALEEAMGTERKQMLDSEKEIAAVARRAIYYTRSLPAGHVLSASDITFLRPAGPLSPAQADEIVGLGLSRAVEAGEAARRDDVAVQLPHLQTGV
ncbi:N-acetylneuraminate synthase family protein [bacterium]|nr:N-acetylneuraminate synthase family protein [bacterium]